MTRFSNGISHGVIVNDYPLTIESEVVLIMKEHSKDLWMPSEILDEFSNEIREIHEELQSIATENPFILLRDDVSKDIEEIQIVLKVRRRKEEIEAQPTKDKTNDCFDFKQAIATLNKQLDDPLHPTNQLWKWVQKELDRGLTWEEIMARLMEVEVNKKRNIEETFHND